MKLLIVDDDAEAREVLLLFLKSVGYTDIFFAEDAKSAIKQFIIHEPDAVFLDIVLPDRSGLDVMREIKSLDKKSNIIMMTAYRDADKVIEAFREGALDCVLKPFNFEYIKNNVLPRITPKG